MDVALALLDVFIAGTGAVLSSIAFGGARRYKEPRFALVGLGVAVLALAGAVAAASVIGGVTAPQIQLGVFPASVVLAAEILLYLSVVLRRTGPGLAASP